MNDFNLGELEKRVRTLEDRLEILNLLAGSPFSSDVPSASFQEAMYTDDAVMDRGAEFSEVNGRDDLVAIIRGQHHLAAVASGMAHFCGLPHIRIDGDRAVATGLLQIVVPNPVGPEIELGRYAARRGLVVWRLTANRWELVRTEAGWRVAKRVIRPAPSEDALGLLSAGIDATSESRSASVETS